MGAQMELRHLRYFVAVANAGNLTVAAQRMLHTSQPSSIGSVYAARLLLLIWVGRPHLWACFVSSEIADQHDIAAGFAARKQQLLQPRKCRSDTIIARILAEKSESSFAPSHSFCRCTTFWRGTGSDDQRGSIYDDLPRTDQRRLLFK